MRIISGNWKGRQLKTLKGMLTRPTADKIKGSIFNILAGRVDGACVLDLFAGSGSLSFEALSRGAAKAVLVEKSPQACGIIKENITLLGAENAAVYQMDACSFLKQNTERFDLVFIDPPYRQGLALKALTYMRDNPILKPKGIIIAETASDEVIEEGLYPEDGIHPLEIRIARAYGDTKIWFIQNSTE